LAAPALGQQSKLADTVKAARQDMEQETSDELVGTESHQRFLIAVTVVCPALEGDITILQGE
jgi:hypothetical protein